MDNINELKEKFDLFAGRVRKHGLRGAREVRERDMEELLDVAEELSDDGRISEAYTLYATFFVDQGKTPKAEEPAEKGLAFAEQAGDDHDPRSSGSSVYVTHPADISGDSTERERLAGLLTGEAETIVAINEALERIDAGTYGVCEGYGGEILAARLEIVPEARYCVQCKDRVEG